ncbi:SARP family transcriptional regulator, partial [Streptomyces sp. BF-3]
MLGPLRAWRDGTPLDLGPVRRQSVLAALMLRADSRVSHEQLIDDLWDGRALDVAGAGPADSVIRSGKGWYGFVGRAVRLDVSDLDERAAEAQTAKASGDADTAVERYTEALALFRGEPLTGLPGQRARMERLRLGERRLSLRLERLECLVLLGRSADTLDELAALSTSDPLDESVLALRMRALYAGGRQAEALNAYEHMRTRLRDELGVDPGPSLRTMYEAVLRQDDERLVGPVAGRLHSGSS